VITGKPSSPAGGLCALVIAKLLVSPILQRQVARYSEKRADHDCNYGESREQ
jgi:hypothetical protein